MAKQTQLKFAVTNDDEDDGDNNIDDEYVDVDEGVEDYSEKKTPKKRKGVSSSTTQNVVLKKCMINLDTLDLKSN